MSVINQEDVLNEVVISLRNADVLSTTIRGVTRTTKTDTLVAKNTIIIGRNNVKNIKNITINATPYTDYTVNYDDGSCTITLGSNQTGTSIVTYDYGTDKIFTGYPRNDLNLDSFPRISVEYIDITSESGGFGNVNRNKHDISILMYSTNKKEIRNTITLIRTWCINNQNSLSTLRLIKPVMMGPLVLAGEFAKFKDKVMKQNFDFAGLLSYEKN